MEETRSSQREISENLRELGVKLKIVEPPQLIVAESLDDEVEIPTGALETEVSATASFSTSDLENLLQTVADVATDEADAFWGNVSEDAAGPVPADADVLSYDEAVQLGLTPEDE